MGHFQPKIYDMPVSEEFIVLIVLGPEASRHIEVKLFQYPLELDQKIVALWRLVRPVVFSDETPHYQFEELETHDLLTAKTEIKDLLLKRITERK